MTQQNAVKANFDDWMSGRYWLGDKAPAEGFYGRYKKDELVLMREAFEAGAENKLFPFNQIQIAEMGEDKAYSTGLAYQMGEVFTSRLNEKSK